MAVGRKLAVIFFDEHNIKEAVVVAVWGRMDLMDTKVR